MTTTEIKLRDSNKHRFTLDDVHAIAVGTEPGAGTAFTEEWADVLPKLVLVSKDPPTYAFPEHV